MEKVDRKICLDTNILIEITRNNKEIILLIKELDSYLYTTSISIFEIWNGRLRKEDEQIKRLINSLKKVSFDEQAALIAGDIQMRLREAGDLIDIRNLFIASVCIINNLELLTNNKKHFERLKKFGLKLI